MRMFRWTTALAAAALLLAACGGGADRTKAQVRLVNASSGYAQLDLRVNDELRQGQVVYGDSASYVEAEPGKAASINSPSSPTTLLSFTPATSAKKYYTVLAYGAAGALKQVLLDDNTGEPDTNRTLLRVLNAAPDAGALDIYITGSNDALETAVPVQRAAAADTVGGYLTLNSGTWRLRVTAVDDYTDLRLDVSSVTLASKQVATLVLTPGAGGVLVQSLLLSQQGGISRQDATLARVRVATGLTQVRAQLGASTLLSAIGSAAVSAYEVLPAGNQTLALTVGGVVLPATVQPLVAGTDYTLLVHGTSGTPLVSWISDDNRLPSDRTKARVRLVNGVAGLSSGLSLSVDTRPLVTDVAAGAASIYGSQVPTSTAKVEVAASGAGTLFTAADQTFAAASNYTVFLLGSATSPVGVLRRDR